MLLLLLFCLLKYLRKWESQITKWMRELRVTSLGIHFMCFSTCITRIPWNEMISGIILMESLIMNLFELLLKVITVVELFIANDYVWDTFRNKEKIFMLPYVVGWCDSQAMSLNMIIYKIVGVEEFLLFGADLQNNRYIITGGVIGMRGLHHANNDVWGSLSVFTSEPQTLQESVK